MKLKEIQKRVRHLQVEMAGCEEGCGGVDWRPAHGHLPRGLVLDIEERAGGVGVVIVGQNPGNPAKRERELYKRFADSGRAVLAGRASEYISSEVLGKHQYYSRLRGAARRLGFDGQIVWTELAKCSARDGGKVPIRAHSRTFSRCMAQWLRKELAALPGWPVMAAGAETFHTLWPFIADRQVVGVPHPTGSFGHFHRAFPDGSIAPGVREAWKRARSREPVHVYLGGIMTR